MVGAYTEDHLADCSDRYTAVAPREWTKVQLGDEGTATADSRRLDPDRKTPRGGHGQADTRAQMGMEILDATGGGLQLHIACFLVWEVSVSA